MNLEFVKDLWLPNIFIYNLKTYKVGIIVISLDIINTALKVIDVLSKLAGLWINTNKLILYSQATHIRYHWSGIDSLYLLHFSFWFSRHV